MKFYKVENYVHEDGYSVSVFTGNDGEVMYTTEATFVLNNMPLPPVTIKIENAVSIEDAFTKRSESVAKVKKMLDQEASKPKIVTPGDLQAQAHSSPGNLKLVQG